jgi:type I restriction enzyme M protein
MDYKNLFIALGFMPKENVCNVFAKKYSQANNYCLEVNLEKNTIDYGNLIQSDNKATQNFSQPENFVVLECVNRLLEKGYKPADIILENTWKLGRQKKGRLDILVKKEGKAFLMIECKTFGKEFQNEFAKMKRDGGQLFSYFQQDTNAALLMLYTSKLEGKEIIFENQIIKIEEDYRQARSVAELYERWNKLFFKNGVLETWVKPYCYTSKALTIKDLTEIKQEDSSFIFNSFLEILRHNVVSDKGNAFNRIFTLFLCKIYDEKANEDTDNELGFQWLEGIDDHRSFQLRLTDLYKNGMYEFLEKIVTDFSETEFNNKFPFLTDTQRKPILDEFRKIRLEKNNEFAIKDVYDEQSFNENAVVVKEIVQLLQNYKLRYAKKQQYLSDFFELLLTTGLKQESGQFFTPVPVAQFIIKSLPVDAIVEEKLSAAKIDNDTLLPYVMDYAAGSGHFVTEIMNEIQVLLQKKDIHRYAKSVGRKIKTWQDDHFSWAINYIYGIEKDYRLVKVGKVGCYLHGDGLANVIHSDGLASFGHPDYKGKLLIKDKDFPQENKSFDILISNPPYSVSAFKNNASKFYGEADFELYAGLTDSSSEIECLFVERTKQLLKDNGVAGIILPSSILNNEGIYTKAREIILQYFEIIAITELGNNTFMATRTNTVVLFLRRRNNYDSINLKHWVEKFFNDLRDVTPTVPFNEIEKPVTKYINHVWENISFDDYVTMLKKEPNIKITEHEIYKEYRKKIKAKTEKDFWTVLFETEKEKLYYFILTYLQKVVLVKTGEKDAEKHFLGYEFSNRRGSEGIHPIQRGKFISECTRLFDENSFTNPEKASAYIYKAFTGDYDFLIHESLKNNISRICLVDMLTFDREKFAKNISLAVKKKVRIESKWNMVRLGDVCDLYQPKTITSQKIKNNGKYKVFGANGVIGYYDIYNHEEEEIAITCRGATCGTVNYTEPKSWITGNAMIAKPNNKKINKRFLYHLLSYSDLSKTITGTAQPQITRTTLAPYQIPLPPLEIQQKIVSEIEVLEKKETEAKEKRKAGKEKIENLCIEIYAKYKKEKLIQLALTNPSKTEISGLDINTKISFIDMSSVSNDGYIANKVDRLYGEIKQGSYTYFKDGDIILAKITPCMENGKCALATNLTNEFALGSSEFHVFRANNDKIITKFLFTLLNRKSVRIDAEKNMTGASGHRRVPIAFYENLEIPVPPLSEQQKIVIEIEKIEAQIAEEQKIIANMPTLKNEVLKKYL